MDKRNAKRRKSDLAIQADQPDFAAMLNPGKNTSLRDLYDKNFLDDPLSEQIRKDLRGTRSNLSRDVKKMLERFDQVKGRKKMLTEKEAPAPTDDVLIDIIGEEELDLGDILVEETASTNQNVPTFAVLAELGLEIKEPESET
jgi:hypothetical protein